MIGGARAFEQGDLPDDDPAVIEELSRLALLRVTEEIEEYVSRTANR